MAIVVVIVNGHGLVIDTHRLLHGMLVYFMGIKVLWILLLSYP